MLYLLFFFLRDGSQLTQRLKDAIPLHTEQKRALFSKFAIVIRAMFKGALLVAALQGMLGGIIFWFLGYSCRGLMGRANGVFIVIACSGFCVDMVTWSHLIRWRRERCGRGSFSSRMGRSRISYR